MMTTGMKSMSGPGPGVPAGDPALADDFPIHIRPFPSQNIVHRLREREIGHPFRTSTSAFHSNRRLYQNVVPNFTCVNIEKPACFLRKFTPDGRFLMAFSADQTSIELYEYQGPAAAESLLRQCSDNALGQNDEAVLSPHISNTVFDTMFRLKHSISVTQNGEQLNRECSLFSDDSRFVIIGSAAFLSEESSHHYFDVFRNNESVFSPPHVILEDYTLYLIDLVNGRLCDKRIFKTDKIFLSHNQGLYLHQNILAVLSVQHQQIHLFQIERDPVLDEDRFVDGKTIGRFCYEDDEFVLSNAHHRERRHKAVRPFRETAINCLKHRLLTFMYWSAAVDMHDPETRLQKFHQNFDQFRALRMWKMQLLDESHLLIKYVHEDVITKKLSDLNSPPSFFVVYNFTTTEIIAVYENTSAEFLDLFEKSCDYFRSTCHQSLAQLTCSPSNNIFAREIQQRYKLSMINARKGGHTEAVRRLLAQLPISAQSYTCSPYLDLSLFSYDEKWISGMERPKAGSDHPIRFYVRDSGFIRFKIQTGVPLTQSASASTTDRKLVAFTFHPHDPVAISVQRTNDDYVVNLHVRHV
jgi:de-etiolated-1